MTEIQRKRERAQTAVSTESERASPPISACSTNADASAAPAPIPATTTCCVVTAVSLPEAIALDASSWQVCQRVDALRQEIFGCTRYDTPQET